MVNHMVKELKIKIPSWDSEEEVNSIVEMIIARLGGYRSIDEIRRELGIKPEDLVEKIEEEYDVEELENRERERLSDYT